MNILNRAAQWMANTRDRYCAVDVVYHRASGETLAVKATPGRTDFTSQDDGAAQVDMQSVDFIFPAAALPFTPAYGDVIEYGGGLYEILAPDGYPVWSWTDPYNTSKRVHTKFYKEANT